MTRNFVNVFGLKGWSVNSSLSEITEKDRGVASMEKSEYHLTPRGRCWNVRGWDSWTGDYDRLLQSSSDVSGRQFHRQTSSIEKGTRQRDHDYHGYSARVKCYELKPSQQESSVNNERSSAFNGKR